MDIKTAITTCFNKYMTVTGRARRAEYWWFALFTLIVSFATGVLDAMLGFGGDAGGPIQGIASLALLLPTICVGVRRLHDIDRTGWWLLISIVPLIGFIVLLVFFIQRGTEGPNRFGPDPKPGSAHGPEGAPS